MTPTIESIVKNRTWFCSQCGEQCGAALQSIPETRTAVNTFGVVEAVAILSVDRRLVLKCHGIDEIRLLPNNAGPLGDSTSAKFIRWLDTIIPFSPASQPSWLEFSSIRAFPAAAPATIVKLDYERIIEL